jgi:hypothetical protein
MNKLPKMHFALEKDYKEIHRENENLNNTPIGKKHFNNKR